MLARNDRHLLNLQKDLYEVMQANGLAISDIDYKGTSSVQKEAIFKAALILMNIHVDNLTRKRG